MKPKKSQCEITVSCIHRLRLHGQSRLVLCLTDIDKCISQMHTNHVRVQLKQGRALFRLSLEPDHFFGMMTAFAFWALGDPGAKCHATAISYLAVSNLAGGAADFAMSATL